MRVVDWLLRSRQKREPVAARPVVRNQAGSPSTASGSADWEQYVADCLRQGYDELRETRSYSDPVFRRVLDPLNSGDDLGACREAESLVAQFRDFADLYAWWGTALLRLGSLDEARRVLRGGLESANEKYPLCNCLGEVEWKARDLSAAVYWWAQGMHCQESLEERNYGGVTGAYLYLHYVAEGLGLPDCSAAFLVRADQIRAGRIRLNADTANDLTGLSRTARHTAVAEVLRELVARYIVPKARASTKADSTEVDRLIRQLQETSSGGWTGERNVSAAKRLGDLGDPRAVVPLTQAMGSISLDLAVAAEEAIKNIRRANP